MSCSCGSSCPCGIPCYCSEDSCKCYACAIALHRLCTICNKPLTDMQSDKDECSCFMEKSRSLILKDEGNSFNRMRNLPTFSPPVSYMVGPVIVNALIPIQSISEHNYSRSLQFIPQQYADLLPRLPSIEPSRNTSPSFNSCEGLRILPPRNYSGAPELHLQKSSEQSCHASSGTRSTDPHNTEISCKDANHKLDLASADERKTIIVQNTQPATEGHTNVQELTCSSVSSFGTGNSSYPVSLEDPVWVPPIPECSGSNSSLEVCNPPDIGAIQEVSTFEKEQASGLNFDFNGLAQTDSFPNSQMIEEPFDTNSTTDQSNLKIRSEDVKSFIASATFALNGSTLSSNSNAISLPEQCERSVNYFMDNQTFSPYCYNIPFYGSQEFQNNASLSNRINEKNNSIKFFIGPSTTENMGQLLS